MVKGQITEKDLAMGLKKAGGFSGLSKNGTRRDSPFGVEHAKKTVENEVQEPHPKVLVKEVTKKPEKKVERVERKVTKSKEVFSKEKLKSQTKAELFSERVTLNISPDVRDKAEFLAKGLQRRKAIKSERITANTIYRVAIEALLADEEFLKSISPDTEEELLELVKNR